MADDTTPDGGFILIVEDDRGANNLEARQLGPLGLEIRAAYSAKEALEVLKAARPALMLLDYSLPDLSALELLAELEKNKIKVPPFIVITGRGDEKMAVEIMKSGAQDYMVKDSVLLGTLLDRVKKALVNAALRTEHERSKLQAEEERDKFKLLFNNANDAIFVHGMRPDGQPTDFVEINEAACRLLGYSREELLKLGPVEIGERPVAQRRKTAEAFARDGHDIFTLVCLAKDGRRIPMEISASVFKCNGLNMAMSIARELAAGGGFRGRG